MRNRQTTRRMALMAVLCCWAQRAAAGPTCLLPVAQLRCVRDRRSGFVAGLQFGAGPQYGLRTVCAAAPPPGSSAQQDQEIFDMSVPDPKYGFPTKTLVLPNGTKTLEPDLSLFYPAGAPITQLIVLEAKNPFGEGFGSVAALVFVYLTDIGTLSYAVCGNPTYANFYLNPTSPNAPPPTLVSLKASFSSPLVQRDPGSLFLGGLQGECGPRGSGYLGGDPNKFSPFVLRRVVDVCFGPYRKVVVQLPPFNDPNATVVTTSTFSVSDAPKAWLKPCAYDPKLQKNSPSPSCVRRGTVLATGKFSVIQVDAKNRTYEVGVDGRTGRPIEAASTGRVFAGSDREPAAQQQQQQQQGQQQQQQAPPPQAGQQVRRQGQQGQQAAAAKSAGAAAARAGGGR